MISPTGFDKWPEEAKQLYQSMDTVKKQSVIAGFDKLIRAVLSGTYTAYVFRTYQKSEVAGKRILLYDTSDAQAKASINVDEWVKLAFLVPVVATGVGACQAIKHFVVAVKADRKQKQLEGELLKTPKVTKR